MVEQLTHTPEEELESNERKDMRTTRQKKIDLANYRILLHNNAELSQDSYNDYVSLMDEERRDFQLKGRLTKNEWSEYLELSKKASGGNANGSEINKFKSLHDRLESFGKPEI